MTQASWWAPGPASPVWQKQPDPDFAKLHGAHLSLCSSFLNSTQDGDGRQIKEQNLRHLKQSLPMAFSSRKTPNWKEGGEGFFRVTCWATELKQTIPWLNQGDAKTGAREKVAQEWRWEPGLVAQVCHLRYQGTVGGRTKGSRSAWAKPNCKRESKKS